jgi:hypothetical protein
VSARDTLELACNGHAIVTAVSADGHCRNIVREYGLVDRRVRLVFGGQIQPELTLFGSAARGSELVGVKLLYRASVAPSSIGRRQDQSGCGFRLY